METTQTTPSQPTAAAQEAQSFSTASAWPLAPKVLTLRAREVHVWLAPLVQSAPRVEEFRRLLGEDERRRAARFHFRKDRERFIVARGLLRTLLGRYLCSEPCALRFSYSVYGKPSLAGADSPRGLRFNLSHSGDFALLAVTCGRDIGVDIERLRTDFANEEIAERFFSPREVERLRALPAGLRLEAFFNCWTRKEAYIKAHGEGLSLPLDGFDVTLAPDEPAVLLSTRDDPREASRWSLRALHPWPGYVAALAVEGDGWRLKTWRWPE